MITRIVTLIGGLEVTRVVEDEPTDLHQYGLSPSPIEITIKRSGAAEPQRLLLGGKAPIGGSVYAKLSSGPRVILVASDLGDAADKSTFDLRDKAVLKFDRQKIDGLEIETAGHTIQLRRQDLEWELMKPFHTRADLGVVSGLLTTLETLQMTSIVAVTRAGLGQLSTGQSHFDRETCDRQRERDIAGRRQRR